MHDSQLQYWAGARAGWTGRNAKISLTNGLKNMPEAKPCDLNWIESVFSDGCSDVMGIDGNLRHILYDCLKRSDTSQTIGVFGCIKVSYTPVEAPILKLISLAQTVALFQRYSFPHPRLQRPPRAFAAISSASAFVMLMRCKSRLNEHSVLCIYIIRPSGELVTPGLGKKCI